MSKPFKGIVVPRVNHARGGLFLPAHSRLHDDRPKFTCIVCVQNGEPGEFYDPIVYERHVNACTERNPDTIRKMSPALSAPGLFDDNYHGSDLEWKRWLEKHEVEIREGRMNDKTSDGKS